MKTDIAILPLPVKSSKSVPPLEPISTRLKISVAACVVPACALRADKHAQAGGDGECECDVLRIGLQTVLE